MKGKVRNIISYMIPAVAVLFLMTVILAVQGMWPFGRYTIDFYDMGQQLASEYLQIYDEIHGSKSMVFDWYTCLGRGIPGGTYISLLNLLYYFVPRNMILETFSIMLVLKVMGMAVTMRIFLKKEVGSCPDFFSIILSVGYGLCGFVLMNYTIIVWLDIAILIPLMLMYTQKLLRDGQMIGYIVCTSLALLINFYIPVMALLFIFFMTGIYIISLKLKSPNTNVNNAGNVYVLRLGLGTVTSVLITSFAWLPKVCASAGSMRFENEAEKGIIAQYAKILNHVLPDYATRWWCLLGISFAGAVTIVGMYKDLRNRQLKRLIFVMGGFLCLLLQLVFENIQLIWHFGSYVNYPARDGFLMYLMFALSAAVYAKDVLGEAEKSSISVIVPLGGIVVTILLCSIGIYWYKVNPGMSVYTVFRVSVLCVMAGFLIYLALIVFKSGKYAKLSVFLICAELIFYGVLLIGKPTYITGYSEEPEQDGGYITVSNELNQVFDIQSSRLDRIKNPDTSLNTNYGNVLKRATLTGWPALLPGDVIKDAYKMGNSIQYTRILDAGGNAFTDALMHTTQILSLCDQDEELYEKIKSADIVTDSKTGETRKFALYDCKYVLPFGTVSDNLDELVKIGDANNSLEFTNAAYRALGGENGDIAREIVIDGLGRDVSINVEGRKALYFTANCGDAEYGNIHLYVNGNSVAVPTLKNPDNTAYPAHFNNNCLLLGCFENEEVAVRIDRDDSIEAPQWDVLMYELDLDYLANICGKYANGFGNIEFTAGKRTLEGTVTAHNGDYLVLPIEYSRDFNVKINKNNVNTIKVNALLMGIPLEEGTNIVEIKYFPKTMAIGIMISVTVLVMVIIIVLLSVKKEKYPECSRLFSLYSDIERNISKGLCIFYILGWSIAGVLVYVLPVIYGLYFYAKMIIG